MSAFKSPSPLVLYPAPYEHQRERTTALQQYSNYGRQSARIKA